MLKDQPRSIFPPSLFQLLHTNSIVSTYQIHELGATTVETALKMASQCERAQLALNISSPNSLMSVTVPSNFLPAPTALVTSVSVAMEDIKAEIRDIKHQQTRYTDEKHLSDQVAWLQLEVNAVTKSWPQRNQNPPLQPLQP